MTLKLDEHFRIETDPYNYVLKYEKVTDKKYVDTEGVERNKVSTDEWYYPNLEMALKYYANKSLQNLQDVVGTQDIINELQRVNNNIKKMIHGRKL